MRNILFILLLFPTLSYSQFTYYGNVTLLSQESLDNFSAWDYEKIEGHLTIGYWGENDSTDITDLSPLLPLKEVTKFLEIYKNPKLKNLHGLDSLERVTLLIISQNRQLSSLSGLGNPNTPLNSDGIEIHSCPSLTSLSGLGFPNAPLNTGGIGVLECPNVTNLEDIYFNPDSIYGITLEKNPKLLDISTLSPIKKLRGLIIRDCNLTTLENLKHLEQLKYLKIENCPNLKKIDFPNVHYTLDEIEIRNNAALTSIYGFQNATNVPEYTLGFHIEDNPELVSLDGFNNIKRYGFIQIQNNPKLTFLHGLLDNTEKITKLIIKKTNLKSFGPFLSPFPKSAYGIEITENDSLTSVEGLMGLERVESPWGNSGNLSIYENHALSNLKGLDSLTYVGGHLTLRDNHLTNVENLSSLDSVGYNLSFYGENPISSFHGLESLRYIGRGIGIEGDSLQDISALADNLLHASQIVFYQTPFEKIEGFNQLNADSRKLNIFISNPYLKEIDGFSNIDTFDLTATPSGFSINKNPLLETINAFSNAIYAKDLDLDHNPKLNNSFGLCNLFTKGKITGDIRINDNAPGFNSKQEIKDWCLTPTEDLLTYDAINIYPNPTADAFFIDAPMELVQVGMMVDLLDISGVSHFSVRLKGSVSRIPVGGMAPGLYFLRIVYDGRLVEVKKILVE